VHVAGDKFDLKADGAGKENTASTKEKKPAEAASVMAIGGHTRDRGSVAVKAAKQGAAGRKKGGASFIGGAARGGRAAVKSRFVGLRAVKASAVAFA
jgi:asparagine synthase (glutamine-hydrolysing)